MVSSADFVAAARTWVGVPFRHQGRSRRGVDCVGLPLAVGVELGLVQVSRIRPPDYGRLPRAGQLEEELLRTCLPCGEPVAGGVVCIRFVRHVHHLAICTGSTLIHSYQAAGRVVEHSYGAPWLRRTVSAWRLPGIEYPEGGEGV